MDGDGATDSTAHMYSNMADFLANDVKATPTAMGLYCTLYKCTDLEYVLHVKLQIIVV